MSSPIAEYMDAISYEMVKARQSVHYKHFINSWGPSS